MFSHNHLFSVKALSDASNNEAFYRANVNGITDKLVEALKPLGFVNFEHITGVPGPGNYVCVYWTEGDAYVACVNHKFEVLWNHSCGGTNVYEEKQRGYVILEEKANPEPGDRAYPKKGTDIGMIEYIVREKACVSFGETDLPDHHVPVKGMTWNKDKQYWYYESYQED